MTYLASLVLSISVMLSGTYAALPAPSQPSVVVYTIPGCIGCGMAKSMFERRNIPFKEVNVQRNQVNYNEMVNKAGGKPGDQMSVPQIFINGKYIGGYSDVSNEQLDALEARFSPQKNAPGQQDNPPREMSGQEDAAG